MKLLKRVIVPTIAMSMLLVTNSYAETATVDIEAARVRAEKNTKSTIVTVVYEDDEVELLEKENEWSKIKYGEFSGYVKTEFLKLDSSNKSDKTENKKDENKTNKEEEQKKEEKVEKVENKKDSTTTENTTVQNTEPLKENEIIISSNTKLKVLPSFISKNIQDITVGQRFTVSTTMNNWVKVSDGTIEGWILKNKTTKEMVMPEVKPVEDTTNNATTENNENANNNSNNENKTENKPSEEEPDRKGSVDSKKTGKVTVETAKIREKATTKSKNTGFLDYGDIITITGEENDFYKFTFEGKSGYVSKDLIKIEEKKTSSRSLTEERKEEQKQEKINEEIKEELKKETKNEQNVENSSAKQEENISNIIQNTNNQVVEIAKQYLNFPYVLGGKTPDTGFDCSGFTRFVYKKFGFNLASTAAGQTNIGDEISRENLMPGDLILFENEEKTKIGHTGIYLGNNEFIHAANPKRGVVIDNIVTNSYYNERFVSARRIVK